MKRLLVPLPAANLVWFDEIDSSHVLASRLTTGWSAADNPELGETVIVAGRQTAGRGRGANRWSSPEGGLYATWLAWLPTARLGALPQAVGVSLAAAVEDLVPGIRVRFKWPNDLIVDSRKLGGVLIQARGDAGRSWVAVSFGINIAVVPDVDSPAPYPPGALAGHGWTGDSTAAAWALVASFLRRIHGILESPGGCEEWAGRLLHATGDVMRVRLHDREVEGEFAGVGRDGQLLLRIGDAVMEIASGEVIGSLAGGGV